MTTQDEIMKIMKGNDCCEHCIYAGIELGKSEAEEHAGSYSSSCNCRHCRMCRVLEKRGKSELLDELEKIHSKVCLAQTIDDEHPEENIILAEECEECGWIDKQRAKLKEAKR